MRTLKSGAEQMSQRRQNVMLVIDNEERACGYAHSRPPCVRSTSEAAAGGTLVIIACEMGNAKRSD